MGVSCAHRHQTRVAARGGGVDSERALVHQASGVIIGLRTHQRDERSVALGQPTTQDIGIRVRAVEQNGSYNFV